MSDLTSVALILRTFYRLVGSSSSDPSLVANGEAADEVAYGLLTRGCRNAQQWMLDNGYSGWQVRSSALSWSGGDDTVGGRYSALPSDFLRAFGDKKVSALEEADGKRWGQQTEDENDWWEGDYWYLREEELWITKRAQPPSTLYLRYHHRHPVWSAGTTIDFPLLGRPLIPAEAAFLATGEEWFVGDAGQVMGARNAARDEVRRHMRRTHEPRQLKRPSRYGNRW